MIAMSCYTRGVERFAAVVTTGIYCQPGCGAKPRAENVRHYGLPAAAEADGYRACLRCRPYRHPQLGLWAGGSELVCRAVGLVLDGVLDDGTEALLGARLGVSPRHLRRLFVRHLGVTPGGLARSARAHFARRLLDDTDLTVLQVAQASGFGSARQLNRACRDVFRMSPRELRARRRRADRLVADGGLLLRLPFEGALDWQALLEHLAAGAIPGVEQVSGGVYRRTIVVEGHPGVLELERGGADHLLLRAHLPRWRELVHLVQRARRIASLDSDLESAERHLAGDAIVGPLLRARAGLRVPGAWNGFEIGVRAIVRQDRTLAATTRGMARLVARFGAPVPGLGAMGLTHTFPPAHTVAHADLESLGIGKTRANPIRAFAAAVEAGEIRFDRSVRLDVLIESLVAVQGLRPEAAHYIALRIGERDAFPAGDLGLRGGEHLQDGFEAMAERWRPWRALAILHLWVAESQRRSLKSRARAA
jgi:AraC family transcriptional regulator, regulatory protein of adaptative response / DNA-3-methyladenine glycosylase II